MKGQLLILGGVSRTSNETISPEKASDGTVKENRCPAVAVVSAIPQSRCTLSELALGQDTTSSRPAIPDNLSESVLFADSKSKSFVVSSIAAATAVAAKLRKIIFFLENLLPQFFMGRFGGSEKWSGFLDFIGYCQKIKRERHKYSTGSYKTWRDETHLRVIKFSFMLWPGAKSILRSSSTHCLCQLPPPQLCLFLFIKRVVGYGETQWSSRLAHNIGP